MQSHKLTTLMYVILLKEMTEDETEVIAADTSSETKLFVEEEPQKNKSHVKFG